MWYGIVRIFVFILLFLGFLVIYKKHKKILKKKLIVISFLVAMVLCTGSYFIPVENRFITFSSPQHVFNYSVLGDMNTVIEGKNSALILYTYQGGEVHTVIPKIKNGWGIGTSLISEEVFSKTWQGDNQKICMISVYWCKHTDDYYVLVSDISSKDLINISDNRNSIFQKNKSSIDPSTTYCSYVEGIGQNYELTIDGEIIHISSR
ncbi:hypothetical protein ACRQU7_01535 [Caproiciproducens sp. R1]|uniref:hypothetical protein n=1 Tax=Caproiciproducens sp. R1 TaxID=3435000 RepID=UPI004033536C